MTSSDSTEAVYDRHIQAFFDHDIDALLADFTDDSVIITQQGVVKGLEQLRGFFAQMLEMMTPEASAKVEMHTKTIEGDVAFHTASAGPDIPFEAETYVIRGGKIVTVTVGTYALEHKNEA